MNWDYPELYYRIYPKLLESINEHLGADYSCDEISDQEAQIIVDEVYNKFAKECPEISSDPFDRRRKGKSKIAQTYYTRSRLVREIISILWIRQLLRRNREENIYRNPYFYSYQ